MEEDRHTAGEEGGVCLDETQDGEILLCRLSLRVTLGVWEPKKSDTPYDFTATIRFTIISEHGPVG